MKPNSQMRNAQPPGKSKFSPEEPAPLAPKSPRKKKAKEAADDDSPDKLIEQAFGKYPAFKLAQLCASLRGQEEDFSFIDQWDDWARWRGDADVEEANTVIFDALELVFECDRILQDKACVTAIYAQVKRRWSHGQDAVDAVVKGKSAPVNRVQASLVVKELAQNPLPVRMRKALERLPTEASGAVSGWKIAETVLATIPEKQRAAFWEVFANSYEAALNPGDPHNLPNLKPYVKKPIPKENVERVAILLYRFAQKRINRLIKQKRVAVAADSRKKKQLKTKQSKLT